MQNLNLHGTFKTSKVLFWVEVFVCMHFKDLTGHGLCSLSFLHVVAPCYFAE